MPGVRIDVVGAEARFHQLGGGVALPDRPLAGAEHADRARSLGGEGLLPFHRHDVEGLIPGDRLEVAVLVERAVALAEERLGQPVVAVHDLGEEVALHAVEAAVDLGLGVAVCGDDAAVLACHHHRAAGATEAAGRLGPAQAGERRVGGEVLRQCRHRQPRRGGRRRDRLRLDDVAPRDPGHRQAP